MNTTVIGVIGIVAALFLMGTTIRVQDSKIKLLEVQNKSITKERDDSWAENKTLRADITTVRTKCEEAKQVVYSSVAG